MRITKIDCHVLVIPNYKTEACSSAQDDLVVEIHTDEGIVGIGETDTNPWIARECIRAKGTHCMGLGLEEMLIGENPLEPQRIWQKLYSGSKMSGRRGAVICAMGAIDMALWDIKGKAESQPIHELLGGAVKESIPTYASLMPNGDTLKSYREGLVQAAMRAKECGFRAGKMEVCIRGPYSHNGIQADNDSIVEIVGECRAAVGPNFTMMVDVAYCWSNAREALSVLERLAEFNLFFLETPIDIDDLEGYAFLAKHSPIRIAAGEWQNTHWEFEDLVERGKLAVLQPDVGRVGGFSEILKVTKLAHDHGLLVVPHCWKSGVGIAASAHVAAVTECCPYIEFLPKSLSDSRLRRELVFNDLEMREGRIVLPTAPGLGIELDRDAVRRFTSDETSARGSVVPPAHWHRSGRRADVVHSD